MTKLLCAAILAMIILSCGQNKIQVDKGKEKINNVCDSIMQTFAKENFSEAFDILKQNSVLAASVIDTLKVTTTNFANNSFPVYGKIRSYEFVSEHKIKDIISKRFYILKFDMYYLKFDITLYNNGDGWTITSFAYNEDLTELLY